MPSHQFALLLEYLQKFTLVKAKVKESSQALNYLKDPLSNITLTQLQQKMVSTFPRS